jgi:hypothetical protein
MPKKIERRKSKDITYLGKTLWLYHSRKAEPDAVRKMCRRSPSVTCYFLLPTKKNNKGPQRNDRATHFLDGKKWKPLRKLVEDKPYKLSPITGYLGRKACALVLDRLWAENGTINHGEWEEFETELPVTLQGQGASTVCARKTEGSNGKKKEREYVLVGHLVEPFCVWVKRKTKKVRIKFGAKKALTV